MFVSAPLKKPHDPCCSLNESLSKPIEAQLGRFISRDPIGFNGGQNHYAYSSNPLAFVDPLGLEDVRIEKTFDIPLTTSQGYGYRVYIRAACSCSGTGNQVKHWDIALAGTRSLGLSPVGEADVYGPEAMLWNISPDLTVTPKVDPSELSPEQEIMMQMAPEKKTLVGMCICEDSCGNITMGQLRIERAIIMKTLADWWA